MAESIDLIPLSKTSMSMESFHCVTFELEVRFQADDLNLESLLKDVAERGVDTSPDDEGDRKISLIFANDETSNSYHAHLTMTVRKSGNGKADLSYHSGAAENPIEPPPSAEQCTQWFAGFFAGELTTHVHIDYNFDESFTPAVSLNFPLPTSEKSLAGGVVAGLAFVLPDSPGTSVIIQKGDDNETYLLFRETVKKDLKGFRLIDELKRRSELVDKIIKKTVK